MQGTGACFEVYPCDSDLVSLSHPLPKLASLWWARQSRGGKEGQFLHRHVIAGRTQAVFLSPLSGKSSIQEKRMRHPDAMTFISVSCIPEDTTEGRQLHFFRDGGREVELGRDFLLQFSFFVFFGKSPIGSQGVGWT